MIDMKYSLIHCALCQCSLWQHDETLDWWVPTWLFPYANWDAGQLDMYSHMRTL